MIKTDWYTNKTWNGKIDSNFEDHLKRARGANNKAEFLQIQGCLLLENSQPNIQAVGLALLSRLLEDFPSEYSSILLAQEKMGDYYLRHHQYEIAAKYYTIVNNYCTTQNSRSGTSTMADLKLAETILNSKDEGELETAYQLLKNYPVTLLRFAAGKYYYAELGAHICDAMHKKEEGALFAKSALELLKMANGPLTKSKTLVGKKSMGRQLRTLPEISAD
jgi:hypothetical protein